MVTLINGRVLELPWQGRPGLDVDCRMLEFLASEPGPRCFDALLSIRQALPQCLTIL